MDVIPSNILSRQSLSGAWRSRVEADNLPAWSRLPGSPFVGGFSLMPTPPGAGAAVVRYGPYELKGGIDAFSYVVSSPAQRPHSNVIDIDVGLLDAGARDFQHATLSLGAGDERSLTLPLDRAVSSRVYLTFAVSFRHFANNGAYGGVDVRSVIGFPRNPLVDLFNQAGSDKGTETGFGNGVPHCYAVDYYHLLEHLRAAEFNFLEIGLDNASKESGKPQDAPSLRTWRQFFPNARLFGYDINDFSFFRQAGTSTFQGDQSSREDLRRFLKAYEQPRFRVILDDGSHASSHQQISMAALFESVEPGGMYIIEDLGWQPFAEEPKTLQVLRKFARTGRFESPFVSTEEGKYLESCVERVEIYRPNDSEFAVLYKKQ